MQVAADTHAPVPVCRRCGHSHVVRNGTNRSGTPNFLCRGCGRQFVVAPRRGPVPDATKTAIRKMLLERLSLRAICRITGVARSWLQKHVNELYEHETPHAPGPLKKKTGDLVIEADELWSFVGCKQDDWWIWVALDAATRQIVAMVAGDRSVRTAQCLWDALPDAYRDQAIVATDFWLAYQAVIPEERHAAGGKETGLTVHVERFFGTLRQRCARFVRKTLSFSKKVENHVGSLWYFIRDYNASLM